MALIGRLGSVSLGEVFQVLDRSQRTGRLMLQFSTIELQGEFLYYVWFVRGRIVAISTRSNHDELLIMLHKRQWVSAELISDVNDLRSLDVALGTHLKDQGVLQPEQLKLLFHAQVIQRVCGFFKFQDGKFQFDPQIQPPKSEMTGLSISTSEATLLGLRSLKDWRSLESRLPNPRSILSKSMMARPTVQFDTLEKRVWECSTGFLSIQAIAEKLTQPIAVIQQVAFRLLMVGMIEELPVDAALSNPKHSETVPDPVTGGSESAPTQVSQSFLQNLLGFLRSKV
jgi:hypothetical protein